MKDDFKYFAPDGFDEALLDDLAISEAPISTINSTILMSALTTVEEDSPVIVRLKKKNGEYVLLDLEKVVVHSDGLLVELVVDRKREIPIH